MKSLILLAIAVGGFTFSSVAQTKVVKKTENTKSTKISNSKKKPSLVVKKTSTDTQPVSLSKSSKTISKKQKKELRIEDPSRNKGLTQEKINHAEEKSNGNAFSGKGQEKSKKKHEKKTKKGKK